MQLPTIGGDLQRSRPPAYLSTKGSITETLDAYMKKDTHLFIVLSSLLALKSQASIYGHRLIYQYGSFSFLLVNLYPPAL